MLALITSKLIFLSMVQFAELISSSSSLPCTVKVKGLVRSRLKIPMIDFAFTIYLPEERSISDFKNVRSYLQMHSRLQWNQEK